MCYTMPQSRPGFRAGAVHRVASSVAASVVVGYRSCEGCCASISSKHTDLRVYAAELSSAAFRQRIRTASTPKENRRGRP